MTTGDLQLSDAVGLRWEAACGLRLILGGNSGHDGWPRWRLLGPRVELAVAKMKNTGSNVKHVFTSRCEEKREKDNNQTLQEVDLVVEV